MDPSGSQDVPTKPTVQEPAGPVVPTERRARCAAHPKVGSTITCRGCGLFLCDECAQGSQLEGSTPASGGVACPRCQSDGHPIPWEDRSVPRGSAFLHTLKAMTKTRSFWASMTWTGGLKGPLLFGLVTACFGAVGKAGYVFGLALFVKSSLLLGWIDGFYRDLGVGDTYEGRDLLRKLPGLLDQAGDVILNTQASQLMTTPLEAVLELFVVAALTHPVARWLGGQGTFEGTFRVLAYANGAQIIKLIPGIGLPFAYLFGLLLVVGGLRRAHGLTGGRALLTALWWIPFAALFAVLAMVWAAGVVTRVVQGG